MIHSCLKPLILLCIPLKFLTIGNWLLNTKEIAQHSSLSKFENLIIKSQFEEDSTELCKTPIVHEIKETLFSMPVQKGTGLYGLPVLFYKAYWPIVGKVVVKAIQSFFMSGRLLKEVNKTFIMLIPKSQSPTSLNHFKPISLCNVVYKTIAKLLVLPLLPNMIAPN